MKNVPHCIIYSQTITRIKNSGYIMRSYVLQKCFYKRDFQLKTAHYISTVSCTQQASSHLGRWKILNISPLVWLSSENKLLSLKSTGNYFLVRFEALIFISQVSRFVMLLQFSFYKNGIKHIEINNYWEIYNITYGKYNKV